MSAHFDFAHCKQKGFTLIELLVSVSIIAILSAIGLLAYSDFTKNARDSARKSDLKLIQSALENFHADQLYYPYEITMGGSLTADSKIYLNKIPNDPLPSRDYSYVASGTNCAETTPQNCTSYCLFVDMEGQQPDSDVGCNPLSPYDYGVTRP